ncbi:MAG: N-6 DNA methylase [Planctomycetota bacterium]
MSDPKQIAQLVERFDRNREAYRSGQYNEAQLRQEFINPFFIALGWDVYNTKGYAEAYKEVIHEDALSVGGKHEAPDYCFRIGGVRKFFVEAKKPSVKIKDEPAAAFQLRRYAWSAKLPLSILTDFEEFAVYDCRMKPVQTDAPAKARVQYVTYSDYPEKWGDIASVFSQEAILQGSFDKYAESTRAKKGTAEVDDAFLQEIESWRSVLARNIALRNPRLSTRELNFAVQRTIDRIIFLRICEDRGIELYGNLMKLQNGTGVYARLREIYNRADERYNSGLFHFQPEKDRPEPPDELTPRLTIDDKPLKDIIKHLYYPDSPYEFSVLPADILGQVYEQFLGKVIRLTPGHHAVVEDKPEVKKAGGVYYTPTYIVDYIVKNTVGRLLEGKTPKQAEKLRILDPACGSGSFLIGAYQRLLDWHLDYYINHDPDALAKKRIPPIYRPPVAQPPGGSEPPGGFWRLTTSERKRILLTNIYGVDIDPQAVEVTKLSLLLKVLEGESQQSIQNQLQLFHERALPDLARNIKCGNSLIGPDFYQGKQLSLIDEDERYRINAFDWNAEFPEIMKAGGFDAVIGNPPYVFGRDWKALGISDSVKSYLGNRYSASPYQLDMFSLFMEKATILCRTGGMVGQIVPNVWLTNTYSATTRSFIINKARGLMIAGTPKDVFPGLTVDTIVYFMEKAAAKSITFDVCTMDARSEHHVGTYNTDSYADGIRPISVSTSPALAELLLRIRNRCIQLMELAEITRGVHPYRIGGYGESAFQRGPQTSRDVEERPYHSPNVKEGYRPFIYGRDLERFVAPKANDYVKYGPWLAEPRDPRFFEGTRIYSRKILGDRLVLAVETGDSVADQQVYITKPKSDLPSALFLAAVLGSRMMACYIRLYYDELNDAFPQIKVGQLKELPIPRLDLCEPADKSRHDRMVELVERMLALHKQLDAAKTAHDKTVIQRQIAATDDEIDRLVYDLYGLTEDEIKIVEDATG